MPSSSYGSTLPLADVPASHPYARRSLLEEHFRIRERGSSVLQEIRAGTSTFLTMSYIIVVNSRLLGSPNSSIPHSDVALGTAASSAVASIVCGLFANIPFALAPGLGLSAYVSVDLGDGTAWKGALAACAVSGLLQMIFGYIGLSSYLMRGTPRSVQSGTVIGMGLLLAFIGLQDVGIVEAAKPGQTGLLSVGDNAYGLPALMAVMGLVIVSLLSSREVPGAVLITVLAISLLSVLVASSPPPQALFGLPSPGDGFLAWDFSQLSVAQHAPAIFAFILVAVFDIAGVLIGLAGPAGLSSKFEGEEPEGAHWAFVAAGLGTIVGAAFGSSPVIVHLESAAGIHEGGKTGMTAVTVGAWFALSILAGPLLDFVPQVATAPILVYIGCLMMGQTKDVDWTNPLKGVPAFVTLCAVPFTFSVPQGIAIGALSSTVLLSADRILAFLGAPARRSAA